MRKHLLITGFTWLFIVNTASAQTFDDPGNYMTAISNAHQDMNRKYMAYISATAHTRRARKVEKLRKEVLESIDNSRYKTLEIPFYKGDRSLRESSIAYIKLCYSVFNDDYGKIVNMEEIAEQSFDLMSAYILLQEKTNEKLEEAQKKMSDAEKAFAAKYNITLVETKDELSNKLEIGSKLNNYRSQVYLVFFKCNWQYSELMKAITKKKLNDIEQARRALINFADEGKTTLDALNHFNNDPRLATACKQVLNFYKQAAENLIPKLSDFFLKEDNFEKMKRSFEAKPAASRTKTDVDEFNKAVKDINSAVEEYNKTNAHLNQKHQLMIELWEKTDRAYAETHMPYFKK
jgi:hypothetical protein